ncbi:MAG: ABC transporter permease [Candidatus Promineifilaceae bacterium]|nr:ABC transporter permease [Candidatus Promineifilaceae bacterium]
MTTTGEELSVTASSSPEPVSVPRVSKEQLYTLLSIMSPFVLLLLWEVTVRVGILDVRFFPPPSEISQMMAEMIASGELFEHLSASLRRIILGFLLGAIPGICLGLLVGWFRTVRAIVDPLVAALYPIPKIALLPLLLVIFGIGEASKVIAVAIAGFFLVLISTAHGVKQIDPVLIQAAENYGARRWKLFTKVILPASLPAIFTGLRLSLGISLLIIVAAGFVAAKEGIGFLIWMSWSTLSVNKMYVGLVVIGFLGLLFTHGLEYVGRRVMPWAQDVQTRTQ